MTRFRAVIPGNRDIFYYGSCQNVLTFAKCETQILVGFYKLYASTDATDLSLLIPDKLFSISFLEKLREPKTFRLF